MNTLVAATLMTTLITQPAPPPADAADQAAIKTVVEGVALLADTHQFAVLETLFAEELMVDYSSLSGQPAELKSASALMTEWAAVLPGFDRTRHQIGDIEVQVTGEHATASADFVAGHWLGDQYWQVDGRYDYRFELDQGGWVITHMTMTLEHEVGSREIFGPTIAAAKANPTAYLVRQQTRQAVLDFLEGLETKDMERVNGVWAEDAVQDMPYSPPGFPKRVVGRDALIEHYAGWPVNAGKANFTNHLVFYPTLDPQTVFVEFRGLCEIVTTGRMYDQRYGGLFHVEGGQITLFREYYDPNVFATAFGFTSGGASDTRGASESTEAVR